MIYTTNNPFTETYTYMVPHPTGGFNQGIAAVSNKPTRWVGYLLIQLQKLVHYWGTKTKMSKLQEFRPTENRALKQGRELWPSRRPLRQTAGQSYY